ncbi:hypothetical protein LTR84_012112 [Exophiala bonariae]|uniref:arginine--tRNA ligase n=1 Tax=Exophiala bonariae TaxID=1690606 RepID=A0AAV9NFF9_9EURO|nr:hypothetical protein LTR84_012112 [Exophiala bonariae]
MATLLREGIEALLARLGVEDPIPDIEGTDIQSNPIDIYLSYLTDTLVKLTECSPQVAHGSIQWPSDLGDLAVILPRLRLQTQNPKALAVELKQKFPGSHLMGHPVDDGIHLRFFFSAQILGRLLLPYIIDRGRSYGIPNIANHTDLELPKTEPKKILVEFSSPNLGKEFDGLHLRSTIIGAYIASLYESMGHEVTRMNFLGDWGQHIGLLAAGWSRFGSEDALTADPLRHLLEVYTQIDELSKSEQANSQELPSDGQLSGIAAELEANVTALDNADPGAMALWTRFRESSIKSYTDIYARMDIRFDEYSGESEVNHATISEVETTLGDKIVFDETKGGWIIDFSVHETRVLKNGHAKLRNLRGLTTYLLRDIAAALDRSRKHTFHKLFYVVSARQDSHFQQLFAVLELMGQSELADRLQHLSFSTARGLAPEEGISGLLLSDILDQCRTTVSNLQANKPDRFSHYQGQDVLTLCDKLGTTSLMTQELAIRRKDDLIFDIPNIGNVEEETGMSLQDCFAKISVRLQGVIIDQEGLEKSDDDLFEDERYAEILRVLIQFPVTVKSSFEKLDSSPILTHLFRLVASVDYLLDEEGESEASGSNHNIVKLCLYQAVRQVLENGMHLIGLTPIEIAPLQEHSGIFPIEQATEVNVEDSTALSETRTTPPTEIVNIQEENATGAAPEPDEPSTQGDAGAAIVPAEESTTALDPATSSPVERASNVAEPQTTGGTDAEMTPTVATQCEVNPPDEAPPATEAITEAADHVQTQNPETSPPAAPGDDTKALAANDAPENETPTTAPTEGETTTSEVIEHEALNPPDYAHCDPLASAEDNHHLKMPEHVASIEAH